MFCLGGKVMEEDILDLLSVRVFSSSSFWTYFVKSLLTWFLRLPFEVPFLLRSGTACLVSTMF